MGLNFAIKITVIEGFDITRLTEIRYIYCCWQSDFEETSINHASLVIILAK